MLGKNWKMMTLAKTITNQHTPDKVFLLASSFSKWPQRPALPRPCLEKFEKWRPLPGPSKIHIFLIRFFSWLHFFQNGPQDIPYQTMFGKVWKMKTLASTITNPHIPAKLFALPYILQQSLGQCLPRKSWGFWGDWWCFLVTKALSLGKVFSCMWMPWTLPGCLPTTKQFHLNFGKC